MIRLITTLLLASVLVACGDKVVPLDPTRSREVAMAWFQAYLEGDGSHAQYELQNVPEEFLRDSWTLLRLPRDGVVKSVAYYYNSVGGPVGYDRVTKKQLHPFDLVDKKNWGSGAPASEDDYVLIQMGKKRVRMRRPTIATVTGTSMDLGVVSSLFRVTMEDGSVHNVPVMMRPTGSFARHVVTNDATTWKVLPPGPKALGE